MLKNFKVKENKVACWINPQDFGAKAQSLVFIHGSGGNSSAWLQQYARLHTSFNIAAVDLPGHGKSGGEGKQDIRDYVLILKDIIQVLNLTRPILIGHSLGAAIALEFAATFPEDLSGLVAAGGGLTMPVNPNIIDGFRKQPEVVLDMMCKFSLAKENRPKFYDAARASLGEANVDVVAGDMLACSKFDITGQLGKIVAPVLAICGEEDKMTPPEFSRRIAESIRVGKLVLIPGAGHMVMMEKPVEFNEAIRDFAAALSGTVQTE
ncbi:MAG: alpha/beta hydrolase [Deltaproteobacteria bacterium]